MIEKLRMVNFEAHADTTIEFHPGVNAIIGETDQGKSSILRAITLVALNRPQGDEYVDDIKKECFVTLKCKGAPAVTRSRKGDKNKYIIESEGEPIIFKAFGASVPDEVSKILNIGTVNIQEQFQTYYLLQDRPGQAAKILHELFGLDLVDKTISVANSAIRAQTKLLKSRKTQIENIKIDIAKYDYVEDFKKELADLESAMQDYQELSARIRSLSNQLDRLDLIEEHMASIDVPVELRSEAKETFELGMQWIDAKEKINRLIYLVRGGEDAQTEIDARTELVTLKKPGWDIHREITDLQTEKKRIKPLVKLITRIDSIAESLGKAKQAFDANDWRLAKYKEKIKLCPVCKKPFSKKELHAHRYEEGKRKKRH